MIQDYVKKLNILYEDNHVIVVEKFENILSQKDITNDFSMLEIIKEYLKIAYNKPGNVFLGLIHRLDRRVGGLMVFAKTSKAARRLSDQIQNQEVIRKYVACVVGKVENPEDLLIDYLYKDEKNRVSYAVSKDHPNAKKAMLKYKVINYYKNGNNNYSYLDVELITGRYNQIRAQLANLDHPLVGDYKYRSPKVSQNRIGLWCYYLSFSHPTTKEKLEFTLWPSGDIWLGLNSEK